MLTLKGIALVRVCLNAVWRNFYAFAMNAKFIGKWIMIFPWGTGDPLLHLAFTLPFCAKQLIVREFSISFVSLFGPGLFFLHAENEFGWLLCWLEALTN